MASLAGAPLDRAGGAQNRGAGGVSSPPGHRNGAWGCVAPEARRPALCRRRAGERCGVRPGGCGVTRPRA